MPTVNNWFMRFLGDYVYALPEPPPRKRTKPMEVLCVGMPRTSTESLQHALLNLGFDHTYHCWDIIYEQPNYAPQWVHREHLNMVRGLVPKAQLLEWTVEDGWEPLCAFLGKSVSDEPFPHVNAAAGWAGQEMALGKPYIWGALKNVALFGAVAVGIWTAYKYHGRLY